MPHSGRESGAGERGGWVTLATAPDQLTAELWLGILRAQGIPAMLSPGDVSSFLGMTANPVRLQVAEEFVASARRALGAETEDDIHADGNGTDWKRS